MESGTSSAYVLRVAFYRDRIFPRLLALTSPHFDEDRRRLLSRARGRVLELGVGTGASLGFYGAAVEEVVGIDPHQSVLGRARASLRRLSRGTAEGKLPHPVRLESADAQDLPYGDASFDTVVAFLTLCSIPDPDAAAREIRRVLKPGGLLLVLEHVRARRGSWLARLQDRLDPLWTRVAGGCHLNRDTAAVLARAGFDVGALESYRERTVMRLTAPRIRGAVRR